MPKYRKKPVVIEAVQFVDTSDCLTELSELGLNPVRVDYEIPANPIIKIETLEGTMAGNVGDYIIKGVNGEFYPCKPDIFAKTYEDENISEDEPSGELHSMTELELVMNVAIEDKTSIGLLIKMPGFELPELITNPDVNLKKKLEYYKNTYDDNLEHKHAKGIKIVGYTF